MHPLPPKSVRYLLSSIILLTALAALYPLTIRLLAQLHVSSAAESIIASQYTSALAELEKALGLQPDDFEIRNELGNVYYKLGLKDLETTEALQLLGKARENFQQALQLHPLDARSAYGLARTEILLEKINYLSGKGGPLVQDSPALRALEQAMALRPASTIYRLAYARYLYLHDETDKLLAEMHTLGRLQPSLHGTLRGEPFWSPAARGQFFAGVKEALAQGVTPRQTLLVASEVMAEETNWTEAVTLRQGGMAIQSSLNTAGDFIRLGSLHLMAEEPDQALENFSLALGSSKDIERDIITVIQVCRNAGNPGSLVSFYRQASFHYGNSTRMDVAAARNLFDLKEYEQARSVLEEANARRQDGETYYWLSRIAEAEGDLDGFELAIQKAVMHDPENASYHLRFSQVLNRLQKYDRAEKEAGLAIDHSAEASIGLYTYRAGLRLQLQDFAGALADWRRALELEPHKASHHYQTGDALEHLDRIDEAAEYYRKAIELEPANKTYIQRLERLVKKYGVNE